MKERELTEDEFNFIRRAYTATDMATRMSPEPMKTYGSAYCVLIMTCIGAGMPMRALALARLSYLFSYDQPEDAADALGCLIDDPFKPIDFLAGTKITARDVLPNIDPSLN